MYILYVCIHCKKLLVSDLSVLSMSVMRFQKKFVWGGWVEGALSNFLGDFLNFFKLAKPLRCVVYW